MNLSLLVVCVIVGSSVPSTVITMLYVSPALRSSIVKLPLAALIVGSGLYAVPSTLTEMVGYVSVASVQDMVMTVSDDVELNEIAPQS